MSNWKKIWDKKQANPDILLHGTQRDFYGTQKEQRLRCD